MSGGVGVPSSSRASPEPVAAPDVVLVTHRTRAKLLRALGSLPVRDDRRIVVVDTGSEDGTVAAVRSRRPDVRVLPLANAGFGRGANAGVRACTSEFVIVANADVRFGAGADEQLAACLAGDSGLGAVGPLVRYPGGEVQASARRIPSVADALAHAVLGRIAPGNRFTRRYHALDRVASGARDVAWLSGCVMALRREAFEDLGGFDPGYFLYLEDVDLGERLRAAGWRLRFTPTATVWHDVGAATAHRRFRSLVAHARSLDRYLRGRTRSPWGGVARAGWVPALAAWVVVTWGLERVLGSARSSTGERIKAARS